MPMNPAPLAEFTSRRSASPITLLIAIIPASPPEISMAIMVMRKGLIPA